MRRVDKLVTQVRARTRNTNYTYDSTTGEYTAGISSEMFLQFLNDAQMHLCSSILGVFPSLFIEEEIIPIVGGQEEYEVDDNVFGSSKLVCVEYRSSTNATWEKIPITNFAQRNSSSGEPRKYILKGGKILLNPVPNTTSGDIRVIYYRQPDNLDFRRGVVDSVLGVSGAYTGLIVDHEAADYDPFALAAAEYICICDAFGENLTYNIPITSFNTGTYTLTFAENLTIADAAVLLGGYITVGKYSTTHPKLPDICERYLLTFCQKRIMTLDESSSSTKEDAELSTMLLDILNSFAEETGDVEYIPVIDWENML
jgi:hypothetical protein